MPPTVWVDQNGNNNGTEIDAANLNADTAADTVEAATNDTLGAGSTYVNNLNRIRYQMGRLVGGAWNAAVQMIPLSQKGAASGVASLDASAHLLQIPAVGLRQLGLAFAYAPAYIGSGYQNAGMTFSAPWGTMFNAGNLLFNASSVFSWGGACPAQNGGNNYINVTTTGGTLVVFIACSIYNWISQADWVQMGSCIDGSAISYIDSAGGGPDVTGNVKAAVPSGGWGTLSGIAIHAGLGAGVHTLVPCFKCGGGGGVTQAVGFNLDNGKSYFNMIVAEVY